MLILCARVGNNLQAHFDFAQGRLCGAAEKMYRQIGLLQEAHMIRICKYLQIQNRAVPKRDSARHPLHCGSFFAAPSPFTIAAAGEVRARMSKSSKQESTSAELSGHNGFSLISNEKLIELYTTMVKCRMVTERVRALTGGERITENDEAGHEASAAGVLIDLLPNNRVAASRGEVAVHFIKSRQLDSFFNQIFAGSGGSTGGLQLNRAIKAAQACKLKQNGKIVLVFFAERAVDSGLLHETFTSAGAQQLPMLFVCLAGQLTEAESRRFDFDAIAGRELEYGFPWIPVDGNDVVAVYRVATESIAQARKGNGPTLIECQLERSAEHDPMQNMESYLHGKGLMREELKLETASIFAKELEAAIEAAAKVLTR
jgi:TPP-dependent pyruvate/acetoin dehydrogenase alpha subunit